MLDGSIFGPDLDAVFSRADDQCFQPSTIHGNIPNSAADEIVLAASKRLAPSHSPQYRPIKGGNSQRL
jgi:hypothetical protein